MIRPQASSAVGPPTLGVPQTVTPRSPAAATSMDAFLMPLVTSSLRLGKRSSRVRRNGVRSRMTQTISNRCNRSARASSSSRWLWNTVKSRFPGISLASSRDRATCW